MHSAGLETRDALPVALVLKGEWQDLLSPLEN